jgi:hypothetical protein
VTLGLSWAPGTVRVRRTIPGTDLDVEGLLLAGGPFAVHLTQSDTGPAYWTLTHVATGCAVGRRYPAREMAQATAERLLALEGIDWSATDLDAWARLPSATSRAIRSVVGDAW